MLVEICLMGFKFLILYISAICPWLIVEKYLMSAVNGFTICQNDRHPGIWSSFPLFQGIVSFKILTSISLG